MPALWNVAWAKTPKCAYRPFLWSHRAVLWHTHARERVHPSRAVSERVGTVCGSSSSLEMLEPSPAPTHMPPWRTDALPCRFNNATTRYKDRVLYVQ